MNRVVFVRGVVALGVGGIGGMAALSAPAIAQPTVVDVAGVRYPTSVSLGTSSLALNGAGIRYRFVIQVYTAGLYLTGRADTPEAVLAAPGAKRLAVTMLREIDANELGRLFTRGMQDNASKEEFSKSIPGTLRLADIFSARKKLLKGDSFSIDFLPGVGTTIVINGKAAGEPIVEPEFFKALIRIWLGPNPADDALKEALLGRDSGGPRSRRP